MTIKLLALKKLKSKEVEMNEKEIIKEISIMINKRNTIILYKENTDPIKFIINLNIIK